MYAIKAVSIKTGLTTHTIRVWERRYNVISPVRTDTNRRIYSEEEVQKLMLLKSAIDSGHSIGLLAQMSDDELKRAALEKKLPNQPLINESALEGHSPELFVEEALQAVEDFDDAQLENILTRANVQFSQPNLFEGVLIPFLRQVGHKWESGEYRVAQEHVATAVIRTFLGRQLGNTRSGTKGSVIVAATLPEAIHEFGAMMAALTATAQGWRAYYLGSNLPVDEIAYSIKQLKAQAILLSIVFPPGDEKIRENLVLLRELLPENVTIIIGGAAVQSYQSTIEDIGAILSTELKNLPDELMQVQAAL